MTGASGCSTPAASRAWRKIAGPRCDPAHFQPGGRVFRLVGRGEASGQAARAGQAAAASRIITSLPAGRVRSIASAMALSGLP